MPSPSRHGRRQAARIALSALGLALVALLAPADGSPGPGTAAAATVCGADDHHWGIDVSRHQGSIDWQAVQGAGVHFAIARLANGLTPDTTFPTNYAGMRANGIVPGGYIFWQPGLDPVAQANMVITALADVGFDAGDLPPTIDVEVTGNQSAAAIAERLRATVTTIENAIGVTPMIYASPKFWNETLQSPNFNDLPLWVAHWGVPCPSTPWVWPDWAVWQTQSTGSLPGIVGPVDIDRTVGWDLPVYTGAPILPALHDMQVYSEGPTPVTFPTRAVGYRGIGSASRCTPASGSLFRLGTTTVTCTAMNLFGSTTKSFNVTVRPPTPPAFDAALPGDVSIDATGPDGAQASWAAITARDFSGASIPVSCSPGPGSTFAIGHSLVICRATDRFGQQVAGSFTVSVGNRFSTLIRGQAPRPPRRD